MKYAAYLIAVVCFSSASAGSYEDFFRAIKRDDAREIQDLLRRGFDPNTPNPDGLAGLYLALREPSPQVAQALIAWPGTQVEWRTAQDESPLMIAALKGELALAQALIARGADVNKTGWTPLHYAATGGHIELLRLLLDHSAYIDAESPNGTTPLMMAAQYGTPECVQLLLGEGADWTLKNQQGLTALDFARRGSRPDAQRMLEAKVSAAAAPAAVTPAQVAPKPAATPAPAAIRPAPAAPISSQRTIPVPQEAQPGASDDPPATPPKPASECPKPAAAPAPAATPTGRW